MTRAVARWGCFLPDLTRLASGSSTTNLPTFISAIAMGIARTELAEPEAEAASTHWPLRRVRRSSSLRSEAVVTGRGAPMLQAEKRGFELDARLDSDSFPVLWLGLCELRLMDDSRWPWTILVPQRAGITELHDLTPLDQAMLTFECNLVAQALKTMTGCLKINTGALSNVVRQLHVHVIARNEGDEGWPGPVWGHGLRKPYRREDLHRMAESIRNAL